MRLLRRSGRQEAALTSFPNLLLAMTAVIDFSQERIFSETAPKGSLKKRNPVQGQGRLEKATAGIYSNISRIGFSNLTMRLGRRAFLRRP